MEKTDLQFGIEILVTNLAIEKKISIDRAIFMIECVLNDLKRKPPTPVLPPALDGENKKAA